MAIVLDIHPINPQIRFIDKVTEIIQRGWQSRSSALRPDNNGIGHTGFIVSSRWNG